MQIRHLNRADAKALQECRLFGLQESPDAFLTSYSEVEKTPISQVENDLENPLIQYFGAFEQNQLVGFMRLVRDARTSRQHTGEVRSVYVRLAHRNRGVGSALLQKLVLHAKEIGLETLTLSLLANNPSARSLYERAGFDVYGTEPQAIKKPSGYIDQTLMVKHLAVT